MREAGGGYCTLVHTTFKQVAILCPSRPALGRVVLPSPVDMSHGTVMGFRHNRWFILKQVTATSKLNDTNESMGCNALFGANTKAEYDMHNKDASNAVWWMSLHDFIPIKKYLQEMLRVPHSCLAFNHWHLSCQWQFAFRSRHISYCRSCCRRLSFIQHVIHMMWWPGRTSQDGRSVITTSVLLRLSASLHFQWEHGPRPLIINVANMRLS